MVKTINSAKYAFVIFIETKQNETFTQSTQTHLFIVMGGVTAFCYKKSSRSSTFVYACLKAVSMLLKLERYFVLIAVKVENPDSHRYVETNGRSTVTAESDNET